MNVILGGGVTALFARDILGPQWSIVPIGRSLYYSFDPPLDNNYIIRDDTTDDYLRGMSTPVFVKTVFSIEGHLLENDTFLNEWLAKKYGDNMPSQAPDYWKHHLGNFAYFGVTELYRKLQTKYRDELLENSKYGQVISMDLHNRLLKMDGGVIEYENLINTIPMHVILEKTNIQYSIDRRNMWCYHVRTRDIDLEGAMNALIVDPSIDFYQASKIGNEDYIFKSTSEVARPGAIFMAMFKSCELISETTVPDAIICGSVPQIPEFAAAGITNMGSGVGDDVLDLGSSLKRIIKFSRSNVS